MSQREGPPRPLFIKIERRNAVYRRYLLPSPLYFAWQNIWPVCHEGWVASSTPIICFCSKFCASFGHPAYVSCVSRVYEIALAYIPRLDNLSREIDENEGGWWMMPDVDLTRVNYHAINILF